jgi:hypothetical protein
VDEGTDGPDRKNNRIVTVTFNADKTFEFSCDSTTMRRPGTIVLQRDPDDDPWTFVKVNGLPTPPFKCKRALDGSSITITDDHTLKKHDYAYTVTILDGGMYYTSPDDTRTNPPMIRNQ